MDEEVNRSRGESLIATPPYERTIETRPHRQSSGVARRLTDELQEEVQSPQQRSRVPSCLSNQSRGFDYKHYQLKDQQTSLEASEQDQLLAQKSAQIEMLESRLKQKEEELLRMEAKCLSLYDSNKIAGLWNKLYSVCEELSEMSPQKRKRKGVADVSETSSLNGEATVMRANEIQRLEFPEGDTHERADQLQTRRVSNFEQELTSEMTLAEETIKDVDNPTQTSIQQQVGVQMSFIEGSRLNHGALYLETPEEDGEDDDYVPPPFFEPPQTSKFVPKGHSLAIVQKTVEVQLKPEPAEKLSGSATQPNSAVQKESRLLTRLPQESLPSSPSKVQPAPSQNRFKALAQLFVNSLVHSCKLQSRLTPSFITTQLPGIRQSIDKLAENFNLKYRQLQAKGMDPAALEIDTLERSNRLLTLIKAAGTG